MKVSDLPRDEQLVLKEGVKAAIAEHLQHRADEPWNIVRQRPEFAPFFGDEGGPTGARLFFRWVDQVKTPRPANKTRPHEARSVTDQHQVWSKDQAKAFARRGSAIATPRMVMRYGRRLPDLEQKALQGLSDAEALRLFATSPDPASPMGFRIEDPKLFCEADKMRDKALDRLAKLQTQHLELEDRSRIYHDFRQLIEVVLAVEPELRHLMLKGYLEILSRDAAGPHGEIQL